MLCCPANAGDDAKALRKVSMLRSRRYCLARLTSLEQSRPPAVCRRSLTFVNAFLNSKKVPLGQRGMILNRELVLNRLAQLSQEAEKRGSTQPPPARSS